MSTESFPGVPQQPHSPEVLLSKEFDTLSLEQLKFLAEQLHMKIAEREADFHESAVPTQESVPAMHLERAGSTYDSVVDLFDVPNGAGAAEWDWILSNPKEALEMFPYADGYYFFPNMLSDRRGFALMRNPQGFSPIDYRRRELSPQDIIVTLV